MSQIDDTDSSRVDSGTQIHGDLTVNGDFIGRDSNTFFILQDGVDFPSQLIDILNGLQNTFRWRNNTVLLKDFVEPSWHTFSVIHENYKATFSKYIESLSAGQVDNDKLEKLIMHDALFSADLRIQLSLQSLNFPQSTEADIQELLNRYVNAIFAYFVHSSDAKLVDAEQLPKMAGGFLVDYVRVGDARSNNERALVDFLSTNRIRAKAVRLLKKDSPTLVDLFEDIVGNLQYFYQNVSSEYYSLRSRLLTGNPPR